MDAINRFGNTPLWTGVVNSRGRGELVALLRERGASPLHRNLSGPTAVDLARHIGDDIARFFADVET